MAEATQPTDLTANAEGLGAVEPTPSTANEPRATVESFEIQEAAANPATEEAYDAADWMQPAAARWLSPPSSCLGRPLMENTGWSRAKKYRAHHWTMVQHHHQEALRPDFVPRKPCTLDRFNSWRFVHL